MEPSKIHIPKEAKKNLEESENQNSGSQPEHDFGSMEQAKEKTQGKNPFAEERENKKPAKQKTAKNIKAKLQKPDFEIKPIASMYTKESFEKETEQDAGTQKDQQDWLESEGQLAVDVLQTEKNLIILAAIAGMKVEDIDVIIEEEIVTVKGKRKNPLADKPTGYFIEECYWGPFSRRIILPIDVDGSRADASMKDGILTISIPKIIRDKKRKVSIRE